MTQSRKAAIIAVTIIISLTICKFVLYWFSGSIAVLSEAWHSFSDIATTLLVLVAIIREEAKSRISDSEQSEGYSDSDSQPGHNLAEEPKGILNLFKKAYQWFRSINSQLKISFVIGLVLLGASFSILWNSIMSPRAEINAPITTGLIFIGLSFGSFLLYRFEKQIGEVENSPALVADSYHNRADLIISLLTGISLLVYHFGYNVDRYVGGLIALYLFIFAIELLVNSVHSIFQKKKQIDFNLRFTSIVWQLFDSSIYLSMLSFIEHHFGLGEKTRSFVGKLPVILSYIKRWTSRLVFTGLTLVYCSTCFYSVNIQEQALLFRFGNLINGSSPVMPGLHMKFPYPIDRVRTYQASKVKTITVGNISGVNTPMIWTKEHGDNKPFLSGDNNFLLPYVTVHYKVKNIHDYYLNFGEEVPEKLLKSLALQQLSALFSTSSFYELILEKRKEWTSSLKSVLQQSCDEFGLGVEIVAFCLKDLHPPVELADAFEEVVASSQRKEALLNDAERKVVSLLSRERIQRMRTIADAKSYVIDKKKKAQGEAANYSLRYAGYKEGGEVMKEILRLQSAEKALKGKKLYILDPDTGIDDQLIYIEKYMMGKR